MVDSINKVSGSIPTQRPQATAAARNVGALNAVQQKTRQSGGTNGASQALKVFSVQQTASSSSTSNKVPRGSLVDLLA